MKKFITLFVFLICMTVTGNAQLKYENGSLRLNTDGYTIVRPGATTYFRGTEHVLAGSYGNCLSIRLQSNGGSPVHIGTNGIGLMITHPETNAFQDVYLGSVYNHSDDNLKTDVRSVESATAIISGLHPVTYRLTGQGNSGRNPLRPAAADGRETGFLAHELMEVLPNSVAMTGNNNYMINYISVIPVLVGAIQEQNARIEALEREIAALKNQ